MLTLFTIQSHLCVMTLDSQIILMRRPTLAGEARSVLERWILSGELQAGQKLNEVNLANQIGVSRGTVREAIRSLADSGLIEIVANRGAYIRSITIEEIGNLYELRGAIFALGCALAARWTGQSPDSELVGALNRNMVEMRAAHRNGDHESYYELNIAFHDLLLEAAKNPKAKSLYDALVKEMHLFRRRGLSIATNIESSIAEHADIVEAVTNGNEEAARQAALKHIQSGHARFMKTLSDNDQGESFMGTG